MLSRAFRSQISVAVVLKPIHYVLVAHKLNPHQINTKKNKNNLKKIGQKSKKVNMDNQIPIIFFSCWEKEKKRIQSVCSFIYLWKFIKNKKKMKKEKKTKYENKVKLYKRKVPIFITFWQKSGKILFDFARSGWISGISGVKNEAQHMYFKFLAQRYGDLVLLAQSNIFFPFIPSRGNQSIR